MTFRDGFMIKVKVTHKVQYMLGIRQMVDVMTQNKVEYMMRGENNKVINRTNYTFPQSWEKNKTNHSTLCKRMIRNK